MVMKQHSAVRRTQCPRCSIHAWASTGSLGAGPVEKTNADFFGFRGRIIRMATHCSARAASPQRPDSVLSFRIAGANCGRPIHPLTATPRENHRRSAYALAATKGIAIQNLGFINKELLWIKTGLPAGGLRYGTRIEQRNFLCNCFHGVLVAEFRIDHQVVERTQRPV